MPRNNQLLEDTPFLGVNHSDRPSSGEHKEAAVLQVGLQDEVLHHSEGDEVNLEGATIHHNEFLLRDNEVDLIHHFEEEEIFLQI